MREKQKKKTGQLFTTENQPANAVRFSKDHQPPREKVGRKPSIKKQMNELLLTEGEVTIPKANVVKKNRNGSVIIKTTTQQAMAFKLIQIAMGKSSNNLKAMQFIIEQIDGKALQSVAFANLTPKPIEIISHD